MGIFRSHLRGHAQNNYLLKSKFSHLQLLGTGRPGETLFLCSEAPFFHVDGNFLDSVDPLSE